MALFWQTSTAFSRLPSSGHGEGLNDVTPELTLVPPNHKWEPRSDPIITPFIPVGIVQRVYTPEPSLLVIRNRGG